MSKFFFRWEVIALVGTAILISSTKPRTDGLSASAKLGHWAVLVVYSLVGIGGLRYATMLLFKHQSFVDACSRLSVFGLDPPIAQFLGVVFGVAGSFFYLVVMELGTFRRRARTLFTYLVVPCSLLYPAMTMGAAGGLDGFHAAIPIAWMAAIALVLGGILSVWFYHSKSISLFK